MSWSEAVAQMHADLLEEFGIPVSYQPPAPAAAFALTVLEDNGLDLEDTNPAFRRIRVRLSDFAAPRATPANGDRVSIGGVVHQVEKVGANKGGLVTLTLNQTARDPNA